MKYQLLPDAAVTLTLTTTPSTLYDLLITAGATADQLAGMNAVEIEPEGGAIRYSLDGSTVSTTVGFPLSAGSIRLMRGEAFQAKVKVVGQAGGETLHVAVGTTN